MNQRRIAISGASGLIGSALCESLVADGWQVSRLDRNSRGASKADGTIAWNPAQGVVDPGELEGFDAIVHLAGRSIGSARWTDAEKMKLRDSRVLATERLAAQIVGLRQPPLVFVGASAVGIYGDCGQEIVDETATAAKDFLGRLAHDWEKASEPIVSEGIRVRNW